MNREFDFKHPVDVSDLALKEEDRWSDIARDAMKP
jgi:hypothetical protein